MRTLICWINFPAHNCNALRLYSHGVQYDFLGAVCRFYVYLRVEMFFFIILSWSFDAVGIHGGAGASRCGDTRLIFNFHGLQIVSVLRFGNTNSQLWLARKRFCLQTNKKTWNGRCRHLAGRRRLLFDNDFRFGVYLNHHGIYITSAVRGAPFKYPQLAASCFHLNVVVDRLAPIHMLSM